MEYIQSAVGPNRRFDHIAQIGFAAHVSFDEYRSAAIVDYLAETRIAAVAIDIGDDNRCAFPREATRGGAADS